MHVRGAGIKYNNNNTLFLYSAFLNTQRRFTCAKTNKTIQQHKYKRQRIKQNKQTEHFSKKLCEMSHVVEGREQGLAGEGEFEEVSFEGLFK